MVNGQSFRGALVLLIGAAIAAAITNTWLALGWIVPVTVSGSSMAPTLLGPHRWFRCRECRHEFAVGLDQLPPDDEATCTECGRRGAAPTDDANRPGERLTIDRTAFAWREPSRWEVAVFRHPEQGDELVVKRIVGLPGEHITLGGGDVLVNGQIVRKSLAEQRALRQLVGASDEDGESLGVQVSNVAISASPRWRASDPLTLEYHSVDGRPITDESPYNQGPVPTPNRVDDWMLTFEARLTGAGRISLLANVGGERELVVDFGNRQIMATFDGKILSERPLPIKTARSESFKEWTFSLFDRQLLLAIGDDVVLVHPLDADQESNPPKEPKSNSPPFAIRVDDISGEILDLRIWRDVYYAVRHGDARQPGAERRELPAGTAATWRLGPGEYFVVGDNAPISDDSRSWLSTPAVDAKLLIGKPLGVR